MSAAISDELQKFIARYVHSVEQLEILCLLAESPARDWQPAEVFRNIQSSQDSVAANLLYLAHERILTSTADSGYRFSPASPELGRMALNLVKTYREKRVTVVETIYKNPLDPIRNFADAFRIRKDKP
jgi:hypothetical protein